MIKFNNYPRLNDKLKARALAIEDLVTDLSDGVSFPFLPPVSHRREAGYGRQNIAGPDR